MSRRVAVVGGGSWGTTVAVLACRNTPTTLWCRRPALADEVNTRHTNCDYLNGFTLPAELAATSSSWRPRRRWRRR
jgi:glycerol-3-phosphate dehydrogenase (NAD(P)+)